MITRIEKFGAAWCGPCKMLDKTLEQLVEVDVVKYDVDEYEDLATEKVLETFLFLYSMMEIKKLID